MKQLAAALVLATLTHKAAFIRARQISHVSYNLWFSVDKDHETYQGREVIRFELRSDLSKKGKDFTQPLLVDFELGSIQTLLLNGAPLQDVAKGRFDGHHIQFKLKELHAGSNRIDIAFTHTYSTDGDGFYRFKDPEDGEVYLYSNFEPYSAHKMFPCFDQPDLKASYELTVEAPDDWEVISNTPEREVEDAEGERESWVFPPTPLFSTYVFALIAGPYESWSADANGIPIRLFARKSIAKYVSADEWLDVTAKGLDFYSTQFGYPYPYAKYDQILVPDFNAGAMENVAAVTFSEHYVNRTRVTEDRRRGRAETILHEMAHMWFGDLVTMRWWNGLWLNESFATFMSTWATDQATRFPGAWQDFFAGEKEWAYHEDELVTTHPIEVPVHDTNEAEANFDGITYGKGAAVLKQLRYFLGEDDFREGIQRYFERYALRNTTTPEFIQMLSEASDVNLIPWQRLWLQTAGVNTIRADWACERGKISRFSVLQSAPPENPILRPHRTEIGLFKARNSKIALNEKKDILAVTYSGKKTAVPAAIGKACPALVFLNYKDNDYVKVELDPASLDETLRHIARVEDPLTRQMLWFTLWDMVVDGKLEATKFADTVLSQAEREKNTQVLSKILGELWNRSAGRSSVVRYLAEPLRGRYQIKIEKFVRNHLFSAAPGSDAQLIWLADFVSIASEPSDVTDLRKLLDEKTHLKGIKIDQERRWQLIQALSRNGIPNAQSLIDEELKKDPSDMGKKAAIEASVLIPTPENKKEWLGKILKHSAPVADLRMAMWNFQVVGQEKLTKESEDAYFDEIPKLAASTDMEFARNFAGAMFPALCSDDVVKRATAMIQEHPNLPAPIMKALKVHRQEEERCIRARERRTPINLAP